MLVSVEQVTGVGPVSRPWQGRIIAAILYLHGWLVDAEFSKFTERKTGTGSDTACLGI